MGQKRAKISVFLAKNSCFLSAFFLSGMEREYTPPLAEKICHLVFDKFPYAATGETYNCVKALIISFSNPQPQHC